MSSAILDNMGLGGVDAFYFIIVLIILICVLFVLEIISISSQKKLKKAYSLFMKGKNAESLETEIGMLFRDNKKLKDQNNRNTADISALMKNQLICFQKVGIVRYDAFREMGGKLSFSIALLDKQDNGFIMNSVHSSTGCYTYTKEIQNGTSYIDLGDEEKEALQKAMKNNISDNDEIKSETVNKENA